MILGIWRKLFSGKIKCLARYLPNTRNDWGTSHSNGNFYVILAGNLFSLKQDLVVSCSRLCEIGPRCILSFYWTVKLVQIVLISYGILFNTELYSASQEIDYRELCVFNSLNAKEWKSTLWRAILWGTSLFRVVFHSFRLKFATFWVIFHSVL